MVLTEDIKGKTGQQTKAFFKTLLLSKIFVLLVSVHSFKVAFSWDFCMLFGSILLALGLGVCVAVIFGGYADGT